jgi:hypothetical protein
MQGQNWREFSVVATSEVRDLKAADPGPLAGENRTIGCSHHSTFPAIFFSRPIPDGQGGRAIMPSHATRA